MYKPQVILFVLLLFLLNNSLIAQSKGAAIQNETRAVVIGLGEFETSNNYDEVRKYADNDAIAFNTFLNAEAGGEVSQSNIKILINEHALREKILSSLYWLVEKSKTGDKAILYYSGIGGSSPDVIGRGFLMTYDFDPEQPSKTALLVGQVGKTIVALQNKGVDVTLILDSHNGGNFKSSISNYIDNLSEVEATNVGIFSAKAGDTPEESDKYSHSIFTYYLLEGLYGDADRDFDNTIDLYELEKFVVDHVKKATDDRQTPYFIGDSYRVMAYTQGKTMKVEPNMSFDPNIMIKQEVIPVDNATFNLEDMPPSIKFMGTQVCENSAILTQADSYPLKFTTSYPVEETRVNYKRVEALSNGSYTIDLPLEPGMNEFLITAAKGIQSAADTVRIFCTNQRAQLRNIGRTGKDHVLIIATEEFNEWKDLNNPLLDGRTMASDLHQFYGFEVDTLMNPTKDEVLDKIDEYAMRFKDPKYTNQDDQLLIFFTGHGAYNELHKQGHLVTKDSKLNDKHFRSYISFADLQNKINNIGCKHILVVLDICYGGTFDLELPESLDAGGDPYINPDRLDFIKEKLEFKTRRILAASRDTPVSDGFAKQHSPFARKFFEALRSKGGDDGVLTLQELQTFVDQTDPSPHPSVFGANKPGSNFLFIEKQN